MSLATVSRLLRIPRVLRERGAQINAADTGIALLVQDAVGSTSNKGRAAFYFDPTLYALVGKSVKLRVTADVITNSAAPGVTFTFGLYPVGSPTGGSSAAIVVTPGTVVPGSTVTLAPGASDMKTASSTDFDSPTSGWYALGFVCSGTQAANNVAGARVTLNQLWA